MSRTLNNLTSKILPMLFALCVSANAAITLSNVSVSQREGTKLVDIYFDADNTADTSGSVSVIISNGASQVSASSLTGAIGNSISEGTNLYIEWDGGSDLNGIITSNLTVTLHVSDPAPAGMVRIPAGTNAGTDPDFSYNLTVDDFLMDSVEVTKSLWDTHDSAGLTGQAVAANHPVQNVTWLEAVQWCNNRSGNEGLSPAYAPGSWVRIAGASGYRLPTEEEWQYAARGGLNGELYPWGSEIDHSYANYKSTDPDGDDYHPDFFDGTQPYTGPVGYFDPNVYGLYDMAGNVYEWCDDRSGANRIRKGGSWDSWEISQRCGALEYKSNTFQSSLVGFRTVREISNADSQIQTLVFDSRDYSLTVSSAYGTSVPAIGNSVYAWKSTVACSVDAAVNEGGTNYTCIGWAGTGSVPMVGSSNNVTILLSNLTSSIIWNWVSDDSDSDGMLDDWELAFFFGLGQSAINDSDFDGQDNLSEYIAGTNPTNAASLFVLTENTIPGGFILEWPTASNRTYSVYWTDNLLYVEFQLMETNISFPRNSATDTTHAAQSQGYYRVDVRKP